MRRIVRGSGVFRSRNIRSPRTRIEPDSVERSFTTTVTFVRSTSAERLWKSLADYDSARTGQDTSETVLNTSNVKVNQFGKLFAMPSDGQIYTQPFYAPSVVLKGEIHNIVIIATENDTVYANDADSSDAPLWKANMVDAAHRAGTGETALNSATFKAKSIRQTLLCPFDSCYHSLFQFSAFFESAG
jgi:hypothetical protein